MKIGRGRLQIKIVLGEGGSQEGVVFHQRFYSVTFCQYFIGSFIV